MNTKLFLLCFFSVAAAYAGDTPSSFQSRTLNPIPFDRSAQFQSFITQKPNPSVIAIGRSDFVFSGPLVEGLGRLPRRDDLTTAQKVLRLPIIRLFVPRTIPNPPEGGPKYFAWRSDTSPLPWHVAASLRDPARGPGTSLSGAASYEYAPMLQINVRRSVVP